MTKDPAFSLTSSVTRGIVILNMLCVLFLVLLASGDLSAQAPRYFVVGPVVDPGDDREPQSYILPLNEPEAIEKARSLIEFFAQRDPDSEEKPPGSIVMARIARGSAGINGDYLLPETGLWSWHVSEFMNFADITAEIYDGNPGFVEDELDYWVDELGQIGFWDYSVIAEFPFQPDPQTEGTWFGPLSYAFWPWVYQEGVGHYHVFGFGPESVWMWSAQRGWLWTSEEVYPYLWSASRDAWFWQAQQNQRPVDAFYNLGTGEWE